jgi:hypothetical protein
MSFVIQITDRVERPRYLACTFGCGPTVLGTCKKGDFLALLAVFGLIKRLRVSHNEAPVTVEIKAVLFHTVREAAKSPPAIAFSQYLTTRCTGIRKELPCMQMGLNGSRNRNKVLG